MKRLRHGAATSPSRAAGRATAFLFVVCAAGPVTGAAEEKLVARTENEVMLYAGSRDPERLWSDLKGEFRNGVEYRGVRLGTVESVEEFRDVYFDAPGLPLTRVWAGLRHRYREGEAGKSKELIQLKVTPPDGVGTADQDRTEHKFETADPARPGPPHEEPTRLFAETAPSERPRLFDEVSRLGVAPLSVRPFLTLSQQRRRLYFRRPDAQLLTVTLDLTEARALWRRSAFSQIEIEISEIAFTEASPEARTFLLGLQGVVTAAVRRVAPGLSQDQTPKIVRVTDELSADPLVALYLRRPDAVHAAAVACLLLTAAAVALLRKRGAGPTRSLRLRADV